MSPELTNAITIIGTGMAVAAANWFKQHRNLATAVEVVKARDEANALQIKKALDNQDKVRDQQINELKAQGHLIHELVNSSVQELRRVYMLALQDVAGLREAISRLRSQPDDAMLLANAIEELARATKAYEQHVARQAVADTAAAIGEQIARGEITEAMLETIKDALRRKDTEILSKPRN